MSVLARKTANLRVDGLTLRFGGTIALDDVSFEVAPGLVYGVIGPNGAGKSSLLNCINGFYKPQGGKILLDGHDLASTRPYQRAKLGIGRTFQNLELFPEGTALDNIMLGRHLHSRSSLVSSAVYWGRARRDEAYQRERVEEIIDFLKIGRLRKLTVGQLSYGQQKMVEIARALVTEPKLLLLDEPTAGMNRQEKEDIARAIVRLKNEVGLTQILIEHDTRFVSDLCDEVVVLDFGQRIAHGAPEFVLRDERVVEAYLGTEVP